MCVLTWDKQKIVLGGNQICNNFLTSNHNTFFMNTITYFSVSIQKQYIISVFFGPSECSVRVNSIQSGLCHDDLDEIFAAPRYNVKFIVPSAIHLPKVDTTEILDEFAYVFTGCWGRF